MFIFSMNTFQPILPIPRYHLRSSFQVSKRSNLSRSNNAYLAVITTRWASFVGVILDQIDWK